MNNAKAYLQQIELCDAQIKNMTHEIADLRSMVMHITSTFRPDGSTAKGGVSDKIGNTVAKIVELEADVNKAIDRFVDLKREITKTIEQVTDPRELRLLYLRYFQYMQWEEIAVEMGYTYRNVCYIHSRALQSVNRILEDGNNERIIDNLKQTLDEMSRSKNAKGKKLKGVVHFE